MKNIALKILTISLLISISICAPSKHSEEANALEEQKMLLESLKSFVDDNPTAADEMEYIIQKKEDSARKKMNSLLEKMATDKDEKDEDELSGGALDYVTRKLNLALVYFYEAKYWLTISECNNIIKVDPKNPLAWIRRGSGYYMISNYEQAKKDWNIALTLNPKKTDRTDIQNFLVKIDTLISDNQ